MLMPEVHSCAQMVVENEKLKKTVRKLRKENVSMRKELDELDQQQKLSTMMKQLVTTRNMEVQTDPTRAVYKTSYTRPQTAPIRKVEKNIDTEKLNKMMILHNNLMKRYEKELRVNMDNLETITGLNLRVNDLQQKIIEMERQKENEKLKAVEKRRPRTKSAEQASPEERGKIQKECDKLTKENRKLKKELMGLDPGFFEEIEDIKFALQQSAKLNKEYERCLKRLCKQFSIPYPHPERLLQQHR